MYSPKGKANSVKINGNNVMHNQSFVVISTSFCFPHSPTYQKITKQHGQSSPGVPWIKIKTIMKRLIRRQINKNHWKAKDKRAQ
jgi:hypothetical protein